MRARNIKPGFFINESLVELDPLARILFIGLWCLADREGRLEDRPKRIKISVLPCDNCDVDSLLNDLVESGFIVRYVADGGNYIQIINFSKHQNPHRNESESTIPPMPDKAEGERASCHGQKCFVPRTEVLAPKEERTPADSLIPDSLIPDSLIPDSGFSDSNISCSEEHSCARPALKVVAKPKRGNGEAEYSSDFEHFWALYPKHVEKKRAYKAWSARIRDGTTALNLMASARNYANHCVNHQTEQRYIKHAATFLGADKPFLDFVSGVPPDLIKPDLEPAGFKGIRDWLAMQNSEGGMGFEQ